MLNLTEVKGATSFYSKIKNKGDIVGKKEVELIPFSSIFKSKIDLIKIDCEGCEYAILNDILKNNLIGNINDGFIIEPHYLDEKKNPSYARSLLKSIGFNKIYSIRKTNYLEFIYAKK